MPTDTSSAPIACRPPLSCEPTARTICAPGWSPRTNGLSSTGTVSCVWFAFSPDRPESIAGISTVPGISRVAAVLPTTEPLSALEMPSEKPSGRLTLVRSPSVISAPWLTSRSTERK